MALARQGEMPEEMCEDYAKIFEENESLKQIMDLIPGAFQELSKAFKEHKEVEIRNRLRTLFKSLMAIVSTDTVYPDRQQNDGLAKSASRMRLNTVPNGIAMEEEPFDQEPEG